MDSQSFYTRQMLMQYGKQLVASRRLARYERLVGRKKVTDQDELSNRRKELVQRVAREIMDNLIFSGSENPIVVKVRERLAGQMGEEFIFRYPPDEEGFLIFRVTTEGEEELADSEKNAIVEKLWHVALQTVDETML